MPATPTPTPGNTPGDTSGSPRVPDLSGYERIVVLTGAGISAASGVPTYRQAGSGWTDARLEQISHSSRYGNHLPELWEFWGKLRALTAAAEPNAAHLALATAEQARRAPAGPGDPADDLSGENVPAGSWLKVATQNVDGLHTRAGNTGVYELHGSIHRSRCMKAGCGAGWDDDTVPDPGQVPPCTRCHRGARPDVVLFGEQLKARQVKELQKHLFASDLCLYVGTSGNVWPAADLVSTARLGGARCVLVNAEPWDHPHPDFHDTVIGRAEELLPQMLLG